MKYQLNYAVIGLLIVLSPILILALHYHNRMEKFASSQRSAILEFLSSHVPTAEDFAASQGGAFQQLASTRVLSEQEVAENLEYQKRQVVHDILSMTEPESFPGPKPGKV
jgi:hypothetical protein